MLKKIKTCLRGTYYKLDLRYLLKNYILFESNPDFTDNTRAVFDRLIELEWNKNYKLIWFVDEENRFNDIRIKNVRFIGKNRKKKRLFYNLFAKYIIDCNKYIKKMNKNQVRIHLTHGETIKDVKDYFFKCGEIDYLIELSDFFTNYKSKFFNVDKDRIIPTGFPRNDVLVKPDNKSVFFDNIDRKKTILWLPTFRNHKNHSEGIFRFPYGIPCINSENELKKLNIILKEKSVLLIIKLHPAEDTTKLTKLNLSNVKLIDDSLFEKNHSSLYYYLANVDALITDYSSVYYDFLLTDKPIGLAISDIDEYIKNPKIIFDNFQDNIIGDYIYNFEDLLSFIDNIYNNKDDSFNERMKKKKIYHKYTDGHSSDRIIKLLEEKW